MRGEVNFFGIFLPTLLVLAIAAFAVKELCARLLLRAGAYRFVWHRSLFDTALYVLLLSAMVLVVRWMTS